MNPRLKGVTRWGGVPVGGIVRTRDFGVVQMGDVPTRERSRTNSRLRVGVDPVVIRTHGRSGEGVRLYVWSDRDLMRRVGKR